MTGESYLPENFARGPWLESTARGDAFPAGSAGWVCGAESSARLAGVPRCGGGGGRQPAALAPSWRRRPRPSIAPGVTEAPADVTVRHRPSPSVAAGDSGRHRTAPPSQSLCSAGARRRARGRTAPPRSPAYFYAGRRGCWMTVRRLRAARRGGSARRGSRRR